MRTAAIAAVLATLVGCSLVTVKGPPPGLPRSPEAATGVHCTTSRGAPVADTVAAVALTVLGAMFLSVAVDGCFEAGCQPGIFGAAVGIPSVGFAGGFGYSAYRGYRRTRRCRDWNAGAGQITAAGGGEAVTQPLTDEQAAPGLVP